MSSSYPKVPRYIVLKRPKNRESKKSFDGRFRRSLRKTFRKLKRRSQKLIFYKMSFGKGAIFYEALLCLKAYQNLTSNGFFESSCLKMQKMGRCCRGRWENGEVCECLFILCSKNVIHNLRILSYVNVKIFYMS